MLLEGPNVIGRAPDATIPYDVAGVSRHHARIVVSRDGVTLEDLGSKNGTYLQGKRITSAPLSDGDEIQIGKARMIFDSSHLPTRRKPWPLSTFLAIRSWRVSASLDLLLVGPRLRCVEQMPAGGAETERLQNSFESSAGWTFGSRKVIMPRARS